jgi:hypothetical protein
MATKPPNLKIYGVTCTAGAAVQPTAAVPNRIMLSIQNTGANPGLVRLGGPVRNDGSDMFLAAGQFSPLWDKAETCPTDQLNFFSALGTTFSVIETVLPNG